jgi:hypothetical protein
MSFGHVRSSPLEARAHSMSKAVRLETAVAELLENAETCKARATRWPAKQTELQTSPNCILKPSALLCALQGLSCGASCTLENPAVAWTFALFLTRTRGHGGDTHRDRRRTEIYALNAVLCASEHAQLALLVEAKGRGAARPDSGRADRIHAV